MGFFIRLLSILSALAILTGLTIKINHLDYNEYYFINSGNVGLAISLVVTFINRELKKKKEENNNNPVS